MLRRAHCFNYCSVNTISLDISFKVELSENGQDESDENVSEEVR